MEPLLNFALTMVVASIGGYIGLKLKLPAGAMMGAMLATLAFNLIAQRAFFYDDLRVVLQILSGAMIGSRMDLSQVKGMKQLIFPILLLLCGMFLMNLLFGLLMYWLSPLDAATSLFSIAPGGATDMAIIATDLGARPAYVAVLQLCRLIIIFTTMPTIFRKVIGKLQTRDRQKQAEMEGPALLAQEAEALVNMDEDNAAPLSTLGAQPPIQW
ncbi:AbrB family transcriptional regulator, partial [Eubacteriales bacterium OttesenSCG-928-M02]|nr:AbrB family transcriptional regulator [Eubacteriales bacterium OttesenSCG-928-M02]